MGRKFIYSEPYANKLPGSDQNYNFRTITSYDVDKNNKAIPGTQETKVLYAPIPNQQRTPVNQSRSYGGFEKGDENGKNIKLGNYAVAAESEGGKPYKFLKYTQTDKNNGTIPSGQNIGDEVLGETGKKSLLSSDGVFHKGANNSVINSAVKKQPGLSAVVTAPPIKPGTTPGATPAGAASGDEKSDNKPDKPKIDEEELKKEQASAQARGVYPDLQYPETLSAKQDCIQFKILKSEPRPLGATAGISGSRSATSSRSVGQVRLPISGPVSDSNRVRYGDDSLNPVDGFMADLAMAAVTEGGDGAGKELNKAGKTIKNNTGEIQTAVATEAVKAATGVNALARKFGLVVNPNMELLFNSPELRSFSFTFRLTPRSESEAIIVRKIIRLFKQGMSVQRTKSQIYLKTPNSFEIQYLTDGKQHPYLPKIKECALTDCSVNYAPDGTYMTYDGKETSMTAYDLSLQFTELEPIFNDQYTELDGDKDTLIGY